jgi:large subunit ribosomal protein L1
MGKKKPDSPEQTADKPADVKADPTAQPAAPEGKPEGKKPKAKEAKAKPDQATASGAPTPAEGAAAPAATPTTSAAPGETTKKTKRPGKPPRRGKKLRSQLKNLKEKIAKEGTVPIKRALQLLKQAKHTKFDETVEIHMWLGIDASQSDQMIRGSVPLPHGVGKSVTVLVFCQGDNVAKAKEAGADYAGGDELIEKIQKEGWTGFDVALATQDMMGKASRLGKVLGPRGLMPTPKAGTVIPPNADIGAAVREFKAGKVEYRSDKGGNVHARVGKLSFDEEKLDANIHAFVEQIRAVKPSGVKGNYIKSVTLSSTMGPGVAVTV